MSNHKYETNTDNKPNHRAFRTVDSPEGKRRLQEALNELHCIQEAKEALKKFLDSAINLSRSKPATFQSDYSHLIQSILTENAEFIPLIVHTMAIATLNSQLKTLEDFQSRKNEQPSLFRCKLQKLMQLHPSFVRDSLSPFLQIQGEMEKIKNHACEIFNNLNAPFDLPNAEQKLIQSVQNLLAIDACDLPENIPFFYRLEFKRFRSDLEYSNKARLERKKAEDKKEKKEAYKKTIASLLNILAIQNENMGKFIAAASAQEKPNQSLYNDKRPTSSFLMKFLKLPHEDTTDTTDATIDGNKSLSPQTKD